MKVNNEKRARKYAHKEIKKRLVQPIDGRAYQWVVDEIAYYRKPSYKNTDYTLEVLNVLDEVVSLTSAPGNYIDKDYLMLFIIII